MELLTSFCLCFLKKNHPPGRGLWSGYSVGTLVERTSCDLMLVKMSDVTAASAMEGFTIPVLCVISACCAISRPWS